MFRFATLAALAALAASSSLAQGVVTDTIEVSIGIQELTWPGGCGAWAIAEHAAPVDTRYEYSQWKDGEWQSVGIGKYYRTDTYSQRLGVPGPSEPWPEGYRRAVVKRGTIVLFSSKNPCDAFPQFPPPAVQVAESDVFPKGRVIATYGSSAPVAAFDWEQTEGLSVRFDASDSWVPEDGKKVDPTSYRWDFEFPNSVIEITSDPVTEYTFPEPGYWEVSLIVYDRDGNEGSVKKTLLVTDHRISVVSSPEEPDARYRVGDVFAVETEVKNVGISPVYDVVIPAGATAEVALPDGEALGELVSRGRVEPVGTREPVTRAELAPGATVTARDSFRVAALDGTPTDSGDTLFAVSRAWAEPPTGVEAQTDGGLAVDVQRPCLDGECATWEIGPPENSLERRITVLPDSAKLGDLVTVNVLVENVGAEPITGVVPSADPTIEAVRFPDFPGSFQDPQLELVEGTNPSPITLAAGASGRFTYRYRVDELAEWRTPDATVQSVLSTVVFAPGAVTGTLDGETLTAADACGGPCRDSTVVAGARYEIAIGSLSGRTLQSGLSPAPTRDAVRFVVFTETDDGTVPSCEAGCADFFLDVETDEGETADNVKVVVQFEEQGAARLEGLPSAYICERVPLGEEGECSDEFVEVTTDDDGRARVWVSVRASLLDYERAGGDPPTIRLAASVKGSAGAADDSPDGEFEIAVEPSILVEDYGVEISFASRKFAAAMHGMATAGDWISIGNWCEWALGGIADWADIQPADSPYWQKVTRIEFVKRAVPRICSKGLDSETLKGLEKKANSRLSTVLRKLDFPGDIMNKGGSLMSYVWLAVEHDLHNMEELVVPTTVPPPIYYWQVGDVIDVSLDAAARMYLPPSGSGEVDLARLFDYQFGPLQQSMLLQEASLIDRPVAGPTERGMFEPLALNGRLRMRVGAERSTFAGKETLGAVLFEGYSPLGRYETFGFDWWDADDFGFLVDNGSLSSSRRTARRAAEGTLQASGSVGESTLIVSGWDGAVGDHVLIGHGDEVPDFTQVIAIEGKDETQTLTLASSLRSPRASGTPVQTLYAGEVAPPEPPVLRPHLRAEVPEVLRWIRWPGRHAESYRVELATDTTATRLVTESEIRADSLDVSGVSFADGETYYWRVGSENAVGAGA